VGDFMKLVQLPKENLEDKVEELNYLKDRAMSDCARLTTENIRLKARVDRLKKRVRTVQR